MRDDFSMGLSASAGYRAGTALPFRWFDLEENRISNLTIHPFFMMDSSALFHSTGASGFLETATAQMKLAKEYGFPLQALFHNEHPSWQGWDRIIEKYLEL